MNAHKFKIGDNLRLAPRRMAAAEGVQHCKVLRLLPPEEGEPQYRVKCTNANVERVVREHALSRSG